MATIRLSWVACVLLAAEAGCARPVPPAEVTGVARYDGEPIDGGIVSFRPLAADGTVGDATAGGAIAQGRYRVYPDSQLPPGKYRVEIRWGKPTGEKREAGYGQSPDVIAEAIPVKYHAESQLTADLSSGPNTVDFDLPK